MMVPYRLRPVRWGSATRIDALNSSTVSRAPRQKNGHSSAKSPLSDCLRAAQLAMFERPTASWHSNRFPSRLSLARGCQRRNQLAHIRQNAFYRRLARPLISHKALQSR